MDRKEAYMIYRDVLDRFKYLIHTGNAIKAIKNSKNYTYMVYTFLHRREIFRLGDYLGIPAKDVYRTHDIDKIIAYIFMTKEQAHNMHVTLNEHHNRDTLDQKALVEMVLDWESARFTKPDKPLNSFDTLYKYYKPMEPVILPILKAYGLDRPTDYTQAVSKEQFQSLASQVTPVDIYNDILDSLEASLWLGKYLYKENYLGKYTI